MKIFANATVGPPAPIFIGCDVIQWFYFCDKVPGWGSCLSSFFRDTFACSWLHCTSLFRHGSCYIGNLINVIPDWLRWQMGNSSHLWQDVLFLYITSGIDSCTFFKISIYFIFLPLFSKPSLQLIVEKSVADCGLPVSCCFLLARLQYFCGPFSQPPMRSAKLVRREMRYLPDKIMTPYCRISLSILCILFSLSFFVLSSD
jgi:hypothetical protein